jgi:hypothetical protein
MLRKAILATCALLAAAAAGFWAGRTITAVHAAGTKVYELRTYTAEPGKLDALHARFRDHTLTIFKKHGMQNVIYLKPLDEPLKSNTLIYLLAHESRDAAKKSWDEFRNDPEWQKVAKESEANGKLVTKVESVYLDPTDYSPMK